MANKFKSLFLRREERGALSGFPLIFLFLISVAAVLGLMVHWFLGQSPVSPRVSVTPMPTTTASANPQALWQSLDTQLQSLDLTPLQTQPVSVLAVQVDGKSASAHWERYRLPDLYTAPQLASLLDQVAAPLGAKQVHSLQGTQDPGVGTVYSLLYAGGSQEPVQIDWVKTSKPRICIIIDDAGYQKGAALASLYDFKVPVTSSIIPYTPYSHFLAEDFPKHGVEVMCHLPMQGHDYVPEDAYKEYLTQGMSVEKAKAEVREGLADLPNCRGLNNHMGSVATADLPLMEAVCEVLKSENMFIIDSVTSPKVVVSQAAQIVKLPVARREFFLDDTVTPDYILKQMNRTADYAKKHGLAVAIGHFKVITLQTLQAEVQKLENQGFQFVYASEVVQQP